MVKLSRASLHYLIRPQTILYYMERGGS